MIHKSDLYVKGVIILEDYEYTEIINVIQVLVMVNFTQVAQRTPAVFIKNLVHKFKGFIYQKHSIHQWLYNIEIQDAGIARLLCRLIPTQCPFEQRIYLFNREIAHIPPLCKLNPFYEEVMALRFKALCYLADTCQEDVRRYC
jgi:hypothetical protein